MRRAAAAGLAYFAVVFAAGFCFGVIRERWAKPALGTRAAEMAELPLMIGVMILAALWVVNRFHLHGLGARLATGTLALLLLIGAELTLILAVRDITLEEYLASRDPVAFAGYLVGLLLVALMPALIRTSSK